MSGFCMGQRAEGMELRAWSMEQKSDRVRSKLFISIQEAEKLP